MKKAKILESHEIGELAGFSLSTVNFFKKGVFVCSQSGNHPLRGFSQIWLLYCTKRCKSLIISKILATE
jgi:hypothetical protein